MTETETDYPCKREPETGVAAINFTNFLRTALVCAAALGAPLVARADTSMCSPPPQILKVGIPIPPTNVQWYNLPDTVSVRVEFTVASDGRASGVEVIDSTAGHFLQEFAAQAMKVVNEMRFQGAEQPCRMQFSIRFSRPG